MDFDLSEVAQLCLTLCDLMDLPGSAVHGIFLARILEAQKNFSYGLDSLANADLTEVHRAYETEAKPFESSLDRGEKIRGSNLILESNIRFLVALSGLKKEMTAVVEYTNHNNKIVREEISGETFATVGYFEVPDLVIADARQVITITVYNADNSVYTVSQVSIEDYVARLDNVGDLNKAVMKFADSAYAYLHR